MYANKLVCPDSTVLIGYFSEEMDKGQSKMVSEHIHKCNKCIEFVRLENYYFMLSILPKAHPLLGKKLKMMYTSSSFNCEAAASKSKKVLQLISEDNKFKLVLRPSKDSSEDALLEIYSFDNNIYEVKIFIENKFIEKLKFENGYAYIFINSLVDLTKIKLYYKR